MSSPATLDIDTLSAAHLDALKQLSPAELGRLSAALRTHLLTVNAPNASFKLLDPKDPIDGQGATYTFTTDTLPHDYRLTVKTNPGGVQVFIGLKPFPQTNDPLTFAIPACQAGTTNKTFVTDTTYDFKIVGVDGTGADIGQGQTVSKTAVKSKPYEDAVRSLIDLTEAVKATKS